MPDWFTNKKDREEVKKFAEEAARDIYNDEDDEASDETASQTSTILRDEQDADIENNAKQGRKKFVELLQKAREISASTTYKEAQKLLGNTSAWDAVDDQTRRQCFSIFVDQLKIQNGDDDDGS